MLIGRDSYGRKATLIIVTHNLERPFSTITYQHSDDV
jgi:hypothetical protein